MDLAANKNGEESSDEIRFHLARAEACYEDFEELMDSLKKFYERYMTESNGTEREGLLCELDETRNSMERCLDAREMCKTCPA